MEKHKGGRPTKFSHEKIDAILNAISHHTPYRIAAEANGIGERTFYCWLKKGSEDMANGIDNNFTRFLQSLRQIEQRRIIEHLDKILNSEKGHRGCQWILEHVFWKYFSSKVAIIDFNQRLERLECNY